MEVQLPFGSMEVGLAAAIFPGDLFSAKKAVGDVTALAIASRLLLIALVEPLS